MKFDKYSWTAGEFKANSTGETLAFINIHLVSNLGMEPHDPGIKDLEVKISHFESKRKQGIPLWKRVKNWLLTPYYKWKYRDYWDGNVPGYDFDVPEEHELDYDH